MLRDCSSNFLSLQRANKYSWFSWLILNRVSQVGMHSVTCHLIDTCHCVLFVRSCHSSLIGMYSVMCHQIYTCQCVLLVRSCHSSHIGTCSVVYHLIQWLAPVMLSVRCHQGTQGGTRWVMHHLFIDCHLIRWLTPVMCCLSGVTRGHRVGCVQSGLPRGRTHQNCECIQYYCCVISITRIWSFIFVTREVNVGFVFSIIALHQLWDVLTDEWGFNSGCIHLKSSQRLYLRK